MTFKDISNLWTTTENTYDFQEIVNSLNPTELKKWIKNHSNIYQENFVIMYHGTSTSHNIKEQGLLKTSNSRKKSIQSQPGFVYLSLYEDSAKLFGELAYPHGTKSLYAVKVPVKDLKVDKDQLYNKRAWGGEEFQGLKDNLVNSLIYGNGARVKRNVENYEVRLVEIY